MPDNFSQFYLVGSGHIRQTSSHAYSIQRTAIILGRCRSSRLGRTTQLIQRFCLHQQNIGKSQYRKIKWAIHRPVDTYIFTQELFHVMTRLRTSRIVRPALIDISFTPNRNRLTQIAGFIALYKFGINSKPTEISLRSSNIDTCQRSHIFVMPPSLSQYIKFTVCCHIFFILNLK